MFASRRFLVPACALSLLAAAAMNACNGSDCLRDSDCDSALECRRGTCQVPLDETSTPGAGGESPDGGDDASTPDASMQDGSAGKGGGAGNGSAGNGNAGNGNAGNGN